MFILMCNEGSVTIPLTYSTLFKVIGNNILYGNALESVLHESKHRSSLVDTKQMSRIGTVCKVTLPFVGL